MWISGSLTTTETVLRSIDAGSDVEASDEEDPTCTPTKEDLADESPEFDRDSSTNSEPPVVQKKGSKAVTKQVTWSAKSSLVHR